MLYTYIKDFLDASKEDDKKIITELANEVRRLSVYASYEDNDSSANNNNDNSGNDETISLLTAENKDNIIDEMNNSTTINSTTIDSTNSIITNTITNNTKKKTNKSTHFTVYHVLCSFIIGILMMVGSTSYLIVTDTDVLDSIKYYIKNNIKK